MERAVAICNTDEQSASAIQYLILKKLTESGNLYGTEDIRSYIEATNRALERSNHAEFQKTFKNLNESLISMEFDI